MKKNMSVILLVAMLSMGFCSCGIADKDVEDVNTPDTAVVETVDTPETAVVDESVDASSKLENSKNALDTSSKTSVESKKNLSVVSEINSEKTSSKESSSKSAVSSAKSQNNSESSKKQNVETTVVVDEDERENDNKGNTHSTVSEAENNKKPVNSKPAEEPTVSYYDPVESEEVKEPEVSEPVVEEPVVSEPVVDEPDIDEPVVDEPVIEDPVESEVVIDSPYARPFDLEAIRNDMIQQGLDAGMNLNEELTIEGTSWMSPLDTKYYNGTTEESVNNFIRNCEESVNMVVNRIYRYGDTPDLYDFNIVILDSQDYEGEYKIYVVYG